MQKLYKIQFKDKGVGAVNKKTRRLMLRYLNEMNISINFVEATKSPHCVLGLYTNNYIVNNLGPKFSGLSAADTQGPRPRQVYLNKDNWESPPSHFSRVDEYRKYVVRHEIMHTLGHLHVKGKPQKPCPLMLPQTNEAVVYKNRCTPNSKYTEDDDDLESYKDF